MKPRKKGKNGGGFSPAFSFSVIEPNQALSPLCAEPPLARPHPHLRSPLKPNRGAPLRSPRRPAFELLEERCVPATWGNPWPDGANLTLSFAPDGTSVGDRVTALYQALSAVAPTAAWQSEVLRAFQTWAVQANINIGLVGDDGSPFGSPGRPQGDDRFGDIRIGGYAMSPEVMALASPFDAAAGTWAGDVKLNTSYRFGLGGDGDVDLFTALLHEAGHVFGLDHDENPGSALAERYHGVVTGLTASDIVHI